MSIASSVLRSRAARAAIWFTRLQDGSLSEGARARFKKWIADPANKAAIQRIASTFHATHPRALRAVDEALSSANVPSDAATTAGKSPYRTRRRSIPPVLIAAYVAILMALVPTALWRDLAQVPNRIVTSDDSRHMRLEDGSVVIAGPSTQLTVEMRQTQRIVRLERGEALFDVAHDPARPFIVVTPMIRVQAIGTRFGVIRQDGYSMVKVEEGTVDVSLAGHESSMRRRLHAGQEIRIGDWPKRQAFAPSPMPMPMPTPIAKIVWANGWGQFQHASVGEIVAEFNRRNSLQIKLEPADLARRQLSGFYRFRVDSPESFLRVLEGQQGLTVVRGDRKQLIVTDESRRDDGLTEHPAAAK